MHAVKFNGVTNVLNAPPNWDEATMGPCAALPVMVDQYGITSVWKPSEEELALLNAGGGIALTIASTVHPPILLQTLSAGHLAVKVTG